MVDLFDQLCACPGLDRRQLKRMALLLWRLTSLQKTVVNYSLKKASLEDLMKSENQVKEACRDYIEY